MSSDFEIFYLFAVFTDRAYKNQALLLPFRDDLSDPNLYYPLLSSLFADTSFFFAFPNQIFTLRRATYQTLLTNGLHAQEGKSQGRASKALLNAESFQK